MVFVMAVRHAGPTAFGAHIRTDDVARLDSSMQREPRPSLVGVEAHGPRRVAGGSGVVSLARTKSAGLSVLGVIGAGSLSLARFASSGVRVEIYIGLNGVAGVAVFIHAWSVSRTEKT